MFTKIKNLVENVPDGLKNSISDAAHGIKSNLVAASETFIHTVKVKYEYVGTNDPYTPVYAKKGDAGFDLRADLKEAITLYPGTTKIVDTGMKFGLPEGYELQIRSRSGLAAKSGIFVLNSPGTIDPMYTGKVMAILSNFSNEPFLIEPGMRICQAVLNKFETANLVPEKVEDNEVRGAAGIGSTGV